METAPEPTTASTPLPAGTPAFSFTTDKGKSYFLHCRDTTAGSGKKVPFYYFGKAQKDGAVAPSLKATKLSSPETCPSSASRRLR